MLASLLAIALISAVFAKGQGKPGSYTTRDGRTFAAGSKVPSDLGKEDLAAFRKEGYILDPEEAQVRELGGVAHDVPDEDLTRGQKARRRRAVAASEDEEEPATVPESSLREDPAVADKSAVRDAHASDPNEVGDTLEEASSPKAAPTPPRKNPTATGGARASGAVATAEPGAGGPAATARGTASTGGGAAPTKAKGKSDR